MKKKKIAKGVKFWKTLEEMSFLKKNRKITKEFNRNLQVPGREISFRAKLYLQLKSNQMLSLSNSEKTLAKVLLCTSILPKI